MVDPRTLKREDEGSDELRATSSAFHGARLGAYTAIGASAAAVPIPWVPDVLARRIRGSLVHEIAVCHGVSLTPEARSIFADPVGLDEAGGVLSRALRFLGFRLAARMLTRFGPIALFWPIQNGLRTFALGHMFDRYLDRVRTERAVRVDVEEARRVRRAIDGALARALSITPAPEAAPTAVDDQRDPTTALLDGILGAVAGAPERLLRRLDLAFDDLISKTHA